MRCLDGPVMGSLLRLLLLVSLSPSLLAESPEREALFGDLHVHTQYSMDAFQFGTRGNPDDAYRFAKGAAIKHAAGQVLQLDRALDFYSVTDHAEYLGMFALLNRPNHALHKNPDLAKYLDASVVPGLGRTVPGAAKFLAEHGDSADVARAWQEIVAAAERHNDPGKFTTFIGYEYTAFRGWGNMHRNIIFASSSVPTTLFSRLDSANPEDLWRWLDKQRSAGHEAMAIPHNANGSDGWMFEMTQTDGEPMDQRYAQLRLRNEPLVEITQVKGTSETHPFLSPNDEFARFEIYPYTIATWQPSKPQGSYVRDAYRRGLALQAELGVNPYQFGLVGASDGHNVGSTFTEQDFMGKVGLLDADPVSRGSVPANAGAQELPQYRHVYRTLYGAAGLTGVWADSNTREAIYAAFRRKETFATSGPRIKLRLFAGRNLPSNLHRRKAMVKTGYARGVPMGGNLQGEQQGKRPMRLAVVALQDPQSAPLQRLQIVKGWYADGQTHERVFDVACADGLKVDITTQRCPDNGASVDLQTCDISADLGASSLSTTWQDPAFEPQQAAFYYARVLENPTCRWSTWDAIRAKVEPKKGIQPTLQERAWTSPVWYQPS